MGYKVTNNQITMTRGDTVKIDLTIMQNEELYEPQEGDSIKFAVKRHASDSTIFLEKEIPTSTMVLTIDSEDTKNLPFGKYSFDVQITFANGEVDTIIENSVLNVTYEVAS